MTHLHKVVDLRPAFDLRYADRRAINARLRLYLDVVADHHVP